MALVTLEEARAHLQMTHHLDDSKIELIIEQAEAILFDYIDKPDGFWAVGSPSGSPPGVLTAACLMMVGALYENREGFEGGSALSSYSSSEPLSGAVKNLLRRYRDPVVS